MGRSEDDSSSVEERKERKRAKKRRSKDDRRKKRSRRDYSDDDESSSSYRERKRRKKEKERKREKKHKKEKRQRRHNKSQDEEDAVSPLERNYALADALSSLLEERPALIEDLPILLIRLAGGTTFDLSQMTDEVASRGIARVFSCLETFGVKQDSTGSWMWQGPDGGHSSNNELVLIRLVRALLDQIGLTMAAIENFERPKPPNLEQQAQKEDENDKSKDYSALAKQTKVLLHQFQQGELAKELLGLCDMILDGEVISLDGLSDERLRLSLESLLVDCALEKTEMAEEGDRDEDSSCTFGYGLPEMNEDEARFRLMTVVENCKSAVASSRTMEKPRVKGPMPKPASYTEPIHNEESESDEEGPLLPGTDTGKPSALSSEMVRARAEQRSRQLDSVKHGTEATNLESQGSAREEWMLVPGKFDFLSALKSGQPVRNRKFEARSSSERKEKPQVDSSIQTEIDAIRQAHEESRGPSLLEQHREKKVQQAKEEAAKKSSWNWDRDKDLDAGRRVDKNALGLLFGSAGSDLKKKFHS